MINSYISNSFVDTLDNTHPNKNDVLSDSLPVNNKEGCNKLFIAYRLSVTMLDRGFIFEEAERDENLMISVYIPDGVLDTTARTGSNVMLWVEVYGDHTITTNFIRFKKIQDVLADLGGVVTSVRQALLLFFFFFNHYSLPFVVYQETFMNPKNIKDFHRHLAKSSKKRENNNELSLRSLPSRSGTTNFKKKQTIGLSEINPSNLKKDLQSNAKNAQFQESLYSDESRDEISSPKKKASKIKSIFSLREEKSDVKREEAKREIDRKKMMILTRNLELSLYRWVCSNKKKPTVTSRANAIIMNKINKELDVSTYLRLREEVLLMRTMLFTPEEQGIFYPNISMDQIFYTMKNETNTLSDYYKYVKQSFIDEKLKTTDACSKDEIIKKYKGWRVKTPEMEVEANCGANKVAQNNFIKKNMNKN